MKISKVKRNNQERAKFSKESKLKTQQHHKRKKKLQKPVQKIVHHPNVTNCDNEFDQEPEDVLDMIDNDDLSFFKEAYSSKLQHLHEKNKNKNNKNTKLEIKYESNLFKESAESNRTNIRYLLPIKTKDGLIEKRHIEKFDGEDGNDNTEHDSTQDEQFTNKYLQVQNDMTAVATKPISTVQLLAYREEKLKLIRYQIGVLSSEILENPEAKLNNFLTLLNFMGERNPEIYITVRKMATASLLEIFKDLLPSYNIWLIEKNEVKLKKETLQLQNQEAFILKYYKQYLQKLEKMGSVIRKKSHAVDTKEQNIHLGMFAINCMTNLLVAHPYFNFSSNIANFLVPFLDNKHQKVRDIVAKCFVQIFKDDKRGELSVIVVRRLNQYIKIHKHSVHVEVISILLSLRIKDVNLDKEKEDVNKYKKLLSHKQRVLALSKKERKRKNKLEEIEKEMLETKAEENKNSQQKVFTEITSLLFTIYFRILKEAPNGPLLSSCLEGVSKFSQCINITFYQDLVDVLDKLLDEDKLALKERLHCIHATFVILSGQASSLNIDPVRFYTHLYSILLNVHIGQTHAQIDVTIKTLLQVLVHNCKNITQNRLLGFVKRLSTMMLNLQHNSVLGISYITKLIMQHCRIISILLDTDCSVGDGIYLSELDDPEYCNARCTSLWEVVALLRYYHVPVQNIAKNVFTETPVKNENSLPKKILKSSPGDICVQYDPSRGNFAPPVNIPKVPVTKSVQNTCFTNKFNELLNTINCEKVFDDSYFDLFKELDKNVIV